MKKNFLLLCVLALCVTACGREDDYLEYEQAEEVYEDEFAEYDDLGEEQIEEPIVEVAIEQASEEQTAEDGAKEVADSEGSVESSSNGDSDGVTSGNDIKERIELADGEYNTTIYSKPTEFQAEYIAKIEFTDDAILIDASFVSYEDPEKPRSVDFGYYTIAINNSTEYLSGGGDEDATKMGYDEFKDYIAEVMDSGLGLSISIKNGYATQIGIWS